MLKAYFLKPLNSSKKLYFFNMSHERSTIFNLLKILLFKIQMPLMKRIQKRLGR